MKRCLTSPACKSDGVTMNNYRNIILSPRHQGFSLIELMVAMAIGLFLVAGVFTVYVNGRQSQNTIDEQVGMIDNARFALEVMASDIRQAGVYGRLKEHGKMNVPTLPPTTTGECYPGWLSKFDEPIKLFDNTSPYPSTCTNGYFVGDVMEVRYSLRDAVNDVNLLPGVFYIQGDPDQAELFQGTAPPIPNMPNRNYPYVAQVYYIAANGDAGDGIPSLHRATLQQGGVVDQVLLTGVESMEIQVGLDTDGNDLVDSYADPVAVNWQQAKSVEIWLVVRSLQPELNLDTVITANIAGNSVTLPATGVSDGIRRMVVSTVATMRNGP